ncbi:unnamed protein product [Diamesa tonsa]
MLKSLKLKPFVDVEIIDNVLNIKKVTPLFNKLVENVKNEYRKFKSSREPKIENFSFELKNGLEQRNGQHYLDNSVFIDYFNKVKVNQQLPFSITREIQTKTSTINNHENALNISIPQQTLLLTNYFININSSRETFYQIQRQHKIWWMKYSANPGKYSISDKNTMDHYEFVNIRSCIDEKQLDVENLKLYSLENYITNKDQLKKYSIKLPRKKTEVIPSIIESVVSLEIAALGILFDAVDLFESTAFHRRLAPFQIVLTTAVVEDESINKELSDLARYIELTINEKDPSINVLNELSHKNLNQKQLNSHFEEFDKIGIPYTIILDETVLKNGLFKLRNRNTTISETIHLSDVGNYVIRIFNSL